MAYLTVREARQQLERVEALDPEAILVAASDPEGNGYRPVEAIEAAVYLRGRGFGDGELWRPQGIYDNEDTFVPNDPDELPPPEARACACCFIGYDPSLEVEL